METINQQKNQKHCHKLFFALCVITILFLVPESLFAQKFDTASGLTGISALNVLLAKVWIWVQVIFGLLILVMIISIVFGMVSSGRTSETGAKVTVIIVCLILWTAIPTIAGWFGFTIA